MDAFVAANYGPELQRAEIVDPKRAVLLLHSADDLIGFTQLRFDATHPDVLEAPSVELQRFYLAREFHGAGLATRLMDAALDIARERAMIAIWLGVFERNARAIAFYRKCGFSTVGSHYFMVGNDRQTDLIMCRSLAD